MVIQQHQLPAPRQLIHRVTGVFYGDILREKIFDPLDMTTTRIISEADIVPNRAAGYRGQGRVEESGMGVAHAEHDCGRIALSARAGSREVGCHALRRTRAATDSLDRMWTPVRLNSGKSHDYGFGWKLGAIRGHRVIEHGGAWQGFKSAIVRFRGDRLTVIVLANLAQTDPDVAPLEERKTAK
jgi:D-alanyl-D-alanine carboxypeptidase